MKTMTILGDELREAAKAFPDSRRAIELIDCAVDYERAIHTLASCPANMSPAVMSQARALFQRGKRLLGKEIL